MTAAAEEDDLPGMWDTADHTGGQADTAPTVLPPTTGSGSKRKRGPDYGTPVEHLDTNGHHGYVGRRDDGGLVLYCVPCRHSQFGWPDRYTTAADAHADWEKHAAGRVIGDYVPPVGEGGVS